LAIFALQGCSSEIAHDLGERESAQMVAELTTAGIAAERVAEPDGQRFAVRAPDRDMVQALEVLRVAHPPQKSIGFAEAFEKSLVPTPLEDRVRYGQALAGEIERTLASIDGVAAARVHLALADSELAARATASVVLTTHGAPALPAAEIARAVAGATPGLDAKDVQVVLVRAPAPVQARVPAPVRAALAVTPPLRTVLALLGATALALAIAVALLAARLHRLLRAPRA
jgi:type III secretion protein J